MWKVGPPAGSMKPLSHPAGPPHSHEALSGCLLRLSLWRQPTQFGCSFPRRELPATCLLSLHSQRPHSPQAPRREKAARYMKVCRAAVGSATLKLSARSVCAGRRRVVLALLFIYFFFFFRVLAFLTNQDVVQRVWLLNGVYLYPSVWVFSKCVGKYSRAKIKKKNERLIFFPLLKYSHETLGSLFISPRHQSGELEARVSPHSSDSLYTLKMKSGIKKVRKSAVMKTSSPLFSFFLSLVIFLSPPCSMRLVCGD